MWPNLIHCTVLSQAPRSEGHVMRKGVPGEYFKGCHKQARVLFLLLLIVTLAVVFKKFWRRVEPVKKVIQQPVDLGCLYTVQKESKYKNFPEGKRNMREISGTSLKNFSLIVKIPQGSSVF